MNNAFNVWLNMMKRGGQIIIIELVMVNIDVVYWYVGTYCKVTESKAKSE